MLSALTIIQHPILGPDMYFFTRLTPLCQEPTVSYDCSRYGVRDRLGAAVVGQSPYKEGETENTQR